MDEAPQRTVEADIPDSPVLTREQGFEVFKKFGLNTEEPQQETTAETAEPPAQEAATDQQQPIDEQIAEEADQEDEEATVTADDTEDAPDDDGEAYVPESFEELAEALGLDVNALASTFRVKTKIDGREEALPLSDVLTGYQLRQVSDRKMQELAEQRKTLEAATREHEQNWQTKTDELSVALSAINANIDMYPDELLNKLLADGDTQAYQWASGRRKALEQAKNEAQTALEGQRTKAQEEANAYRVQRLNREKQIIGQLRPDLIDPTKAAEQQNALSSYLIQTYQIPPESVEQYWDGNWNAYEVDMFLKAMAYDQLQASAHKKDVGKKRQNLGKVMKAGSPKPALKPEEESRRSAAAKFRKATKNPRGQNKAEVQEAALALLRQQSR